MAVMAAFSVVVAFDGWIVGVESFWTAYHPIQIWVVALYVAGGAFAGLRAQRIVAGLVLVSYQIAGPVLRNLPGAFAS